MSTMTGTGCRNSDVPSSIGIDSLKCHVTILLFAVACATTSCWPINPISLPAHRIWLASCWCLYVCLSKLPPSHRGQLQSSCCTRSKNAVRYFRSVTALAQQHLCHSLVCCTPGAASLWHLLFNFVCWCHLPATAGVILLL